MRAFYAPQDATTAEIRAAIRERFDVPYRQTFDRIAGDTFEGLKMAARFFGLVLVPTLRRVTDHRFEPMSTPGLFPDPYCTRCDRPRSVHEKKECGVVDAKKTNDRARKFRR